MKPIVIFNCKQHVPQDLQLRGGLNYSPSGRATPFHPARTATSRAIGPKHNANSASNLFTGRFRQNHMQPGKSTEKSTAQGEQDVKSEKRRLLADDGEPQAKSPVDAGIVLSVRKASTAAPPANTGSSQKVGLSLIHSFSRSEYVENVTIFRHILFIIVQDKLTMYN